jgi:threonine synthase
MNIKTEFCLFVPKQRFIMQTIGASLLSPCKSVMIVYGISAYKFCFKGLQPMSGILARHRALYNLPNDYPIVTLHEGNTPLIPAERLSKCLGVEGLEVYLKYEGLNPTGSFKDRGMTFAVSEAKRRGAKYLLCASTGNTSASAAAYGARARIETLILIPQGKIALGKLSQALMYGARIVEIEGNFDEALRLVRQLGEQFPDIAVVNSINPFRIEGQKSGAFEIAEQLGNAHQQFAPDYFFIPVGNAGNITAYWKGFSQLYEMGWLQKRPVMAGYQAEGSAPIVLGAPVANPETVATAIRIGNPASWEGALAAKTESGGWIDLVSDEAILSAYHCLASHEGIFCEPASAASVAGLFKAAFEGKLKPHSKVVCILTGNGLKDPDNAIAVGSKHAERISLPNDLQAITKALKLG